MSKTATKEQAAAATEIATAAVKNARGGVTAGTRALADKLAPYVVVENGKAMLPEQAYFDTLPEGITPEIVKTLRSHHTHLMPATAEVLGDKQFELMQQDATVNVNYGQFNLGDGDAIHTQMKRSAVYPNPSSDSGETVTRYAQLRCSFDAGSMHADRGDFKKVKQALADRGAAIFGQ